MGALSAAVVTASVVLRCNLFLTVAKAGDPVTSAQTGNSHERCVRNPLQADLPAFAKARRVRRSFSGGGRVRLYEHYDRGREGIVFADYQLCDVVLRDGSTLALRPVRESDIDALVAFFDALSPQSRYFRFFGVSNLDRAAVERLVPSVPPRGRRSWASAVDASSPSPATTGLPVSDRAEVAFTIADSLQGRGIGTRLLERLADIARAEQIGTFDAFVLAENRKMIDVFLDWGYRVSRRIDGGVFHVELSLEVTPD